MFAGSNPRAFLDMVKQEAVLVTAILGVLAALTTGSHDDGLQAITTVMSVYGFVVITLLVSVMWFFRQWGIAYSWLLPDTSALVGSMVALTQIASLSVELAPGLLSVPLPLAMAVLTLPIYALMRRRHTRDRFGRFGGR
jgi:ABC-type dipeptide/oligopeptide/nickel transport system permease subunit